MLRRVHWSIVWGLGFCGGQTLDASPERVTPENVPPPTPSKGLNRIRGSGSHQAPIRRTYSWAHVLLTCKECAVPGG